jgi:tRNA(fMet)-specific endonuclease VapC
VLSTKPAKTIGKNDMLIAAAASAANAFLITTDKDFRHIDNQLLKLIWIDETEV